MFSKELQSVENAFFEAMQHGWASGNDGEYNSSGFKHTFHVTEDRTHSVTDAWGKDSATGQLTGSIQICQIHAAAPEWVMWYGGGNYEEQALPFLRNALMEAYRHRLFFGGRGPRQVSDGELVYMNNCDGNFLKFKGVEVVVNENHGVALGLHRYWGGSLLYLK